MVARAYRNVRERQHGVSPVPAASNLRICGRPRNIKVYRRSSRGKPHGMSRETTVQAAAVHLKIKHEPGQAAAHGMKNRWVGRALYWPLCPAHEEAHLFSWRQHSRQHR